MVDSEAAEEFCPVCGIVPSDELTPAAYQVIWDALPTIGAAQEAGQTVCCPECGRQLTSPRGESGR